MKIPGNLHYRPYIVKGGYVSVILVSLSVRQHDSLQSNERVCIQENFIRGVFRAKEQSNKFWERSRLRSGSRIRIAIRITRITAIVQLPFCFKISY